MDGATFDALLRRAARAASRRGVVGTGFRALTASLVTMLGLRAVDDAAAKKKRKNKKKCRKVNQGCGGKKKKCCKGLTCTDGTCLRPSACIDDSLQAAIDDATPGAILTLCAGTFTENIEIAKNLTLIGAGDGENSAANTILDGAGAGRVVFIAEGSTVTLQDLRLTDGAIFEFGGGIANGGTLALTGCTIIGNAADKGGGIYNAGTLTLTDCAVTGNNAAPLSFIGGGIYNAGTLELINSTVSANTAGDGGGVFNLGTVELINSTVSGNTATEGGGIVNDGTVTLAGSSVTGNHAGNAGGGIYNFGTVVCSSDSTVSDNTRGTPPPAVSNCIDVNGGTGCATCPD